jgi:hypothetical protein
VFPVWHSLHGMLCKIKLKFFSGRNGIQPKISQLLANSLTDWEAQIFLPSQRIKELFSETCLE